MAFSFPMPPGTAYLTEYFCGSRNGSGELLDYPPLHPHHFVTYDSGYLAPKTLSNWKFFPSVQEFSLATHTLPSYGPDLICDTQKDPLACGYVTLPNGTGVEKQNASDKIISLQVDNIGNQSLDFSIECGTKWAFSPQLLSVYSVTFHNVGEVNFPYVIPGGTGEN